jgi:hypothetical protein
MIRQAALATLLLLAVPASSAAEERPGAPTCECRPAEGDAQLREALAALTKELARVRDAMGGPFDGVEGLRREAGDLRKEVEALRREMADLRRTMERSR